MTNLSIDWEAALRSGQREYRCACPHCDKSPCDKAVAINIETGKDICHRKNPKCHRFLIGLEEAESQAEREQSLGWEVGVLDPGVTPTDYHWRITGDDVLCHATWSITSEYALQLGLCLIEQGARGVGVFSPEGECLFEHSLDFETREEVEMEKKAKLLGQKFHKYSQSHGVEGVHVLKHDAKRRMYLAVFLPASQGPGNLVESEVIPLECNCALVYDRSLERYAEQDQKKLQRLKEMDDERRAMANGVEAELQASRDELDAECLPYESPPF
jgi:hypothetical protein